VLTFPELNSAQIFSAFSWVVVPILLSSLIYSVRYTLLFIITNLVGILLIPVFRPELNYGIMIETIGFFFLTSIVILVVMVQRNQIEKDRQTELQMNQETLQREIVERTHIQDELEQNNSELTQFTYTVSHELKTPVVTIKGFIGSIKNDLRNKNYERAEKDILRVTNAVDKMHETLCDLLELSRTGRLMNEAMDIPLENIVQDALELTHGPIEKYKVTVHTQPNLPIIHGDRQRLTEVLQNLLDNAVKYMGDQPHPHVEIGKHSEKNGNPVFFVKDNGMGIAPEYHERIFGLFNKLDSTSEGTGIGLALVKKIIEVHGGSIWVESEPGKGSTFFFTLPSHLRSNNQ
jgi:signal transduction histidine kinase